MGVLRAPILLRRNRYDDRNLQNGNIDRVTGEPSPDPGVPPEVDPALLRSLADGLYAILKNESEILEKIAPDQLRRAFASLEQGFDDFRRHHLRTVVEKVRGKVLSRGILRWFDFFVPTVEQMLKDTEAVLREEYGLGETAEERLELATKVASWLLKFEDARGAHSENAMMLLAMGRDPTSGSIELENGDLRIRMKANPNAPVYTRQECLMRDVGCALGGKLRVNPLWSFARTPLTVHSQGGCPMSKDPKTGVTGPGGQVHGHPGLFIMDAAAFPTPVGVNPSATIAAVAEMNMAAYLNPPTDDLCKAEEWWDAQSWKDEPKVRLEPPSNRPSPPPVNKPLGIRFTERMSGFHYKRPVPSGRDDHASYRAAEVAGRKHKNLLAVDLTANIEDVAAFMHSGRHTIQMHGIAELTWKDNKKAGGPQTFPDVSGTLMLFPGGRPQSARMEYELEFGRGAYRLTGSKHIRDDPGPDAWRDTSALFTTLETPDVSPSYGVIHVGLDGFLFDQLPSFEVTNTDDPARIVWALSSFGAYFFGTLQRIYVPQLEKVVERFADLEIR
jgi:hypothetical protein